MRKKKRDVLVYTEGTAKQYDALIVQVDDAGNEWLSPVQVKYLEEAHLWAKYRGDSTIKVSDGLVFNFVSPMPQMQPTVTSY